MCLNGVTCCRDGVYYENLQYECTCVLPICCFLLP